jgi:hypothetical protein
VRAFAIGLLACLAAVGCSVAVDADRTQCETTSDCAARGADFANTVCVDNWCQAEPKWGCIGRASEKSDSPGPFRVTLQTVDIVSQTPLAGVTAEACRKIDVNCEQPVDMAVSDDNGALALNVARERDGLGFQGYVRFTRDGILPGIYVFTQPVESDLKVEPVRMASPAIAGALAAQIGTTIDPDRGLLLMYLVDCQDKPAEGVIFSTDADGAAAKFYSVNGLPAATATATDTDG